jgi:transglutaminase-like putative cysteine protease
MTTDPTLAPTRFLDYEDETVRAFATSRAAGGGGEVERAVRLYYAVRDEVLYDPYSVRLTPDHYPASRTLAAGRGFCVPKAILLAAAARAVGIPSRLGYADVRNHLATERLKAMMRTDVFAFHGYTLLFLEGKWVKATPAFNRTLCDKFGVRTLDFDGRTDSVFHPFDREGRRHMEYLRDRGTYDDFPFDELLRVKREVYPHVFDASLASLEGDFAREAETDPVR